jgi:protein-disulfide isomerase
MPQKDGKSKRQQIREKRRRERQRGRLMSIGLIVIGAVILAGLFIYPNLKPVEFVAITPKAYPLADMNTMGDPDAPVKLEVWEDFQCPACKNFSSDTEPLLIENYIATGEVYYVFHHYPFIDDGATGKESDQAANASMCAAEQGQFWNYKALLFANWDGENIGSFTDRRLIAFAESLGLDMGQFRRCFNENTYQDQIEQDYNDGLALGVRSTPSIFVDGVLVEYPDNPRLVPTYENIAAAIEAALAATDQ